MAKLTGQTVASSYDQLLIVDDANGISASLQAIEAGDTGGSASSLKISTSKCEVIPASNSTALFEVSQADGTAVLSVDTTNARVGIGVSGPTEVLDVSGNGKFSGTLACGALTATGAISLAATSFNDNNITNVGDISLDTISSDAGTSIGVTLGTDSGDDFNVGGGKLVVEGDTGNVGIGTATPATQLEIAHATSPTFSLHREDSAVAGGEPLGEIRFTGADPSGTNTGCQIQAVAADGWDTDDYPSELQFYTSPSSGTVTKRVTINKNGYVGINEATVDNTLHVTGASGSGISVAKFEQLDDDEPFIRFEGTTASDQTKSLSTDTTVGALTGHVRVSINGTDFWMPYYATN